MSQIDLLLLHPPSVYDFRQRAIMYGPISDLIPSSPVFEMYPLGFLTMTSYLEAHGLKVRIVNLALRMMNDPTFDVPEFLAGLKPAAVGIDLHWLPHAHGSIEIARLVKAAYPQVPVIFGGLSSSYFHQELIRYPEVDYVLRGDAIEPFLYELLLRLKSGGELQDISNLTWKHDGEVRVNPLVCPDPPVGFVDLLPVQMMKMVLRYRDLQSVLPFNGWWKNPITAVFTVKGCHHDCLTCGGSSQANNLINLRKAPVFRTPQNLVKNIADISRFSKGPIFLVGDLFQAGEEYALDVLARLKSAKIKNEIIFELFGMPPAGSLQAIDSALENWSLELSPESHDEEIRCLQDATVFYPNSEMEAIIEEALSLRCHRIDVFFMIGLPQQTRGSVLATIDYCEKLFKNSDRRLSCFISPMGPFVDPGSKCFEQPEQFGYRLFAQTLEEHRQLLVQPSWEKILNYETKWMSREELVDTTYDAAERLNSLKLKYERIKPELGEEVAQRIVQARQINNSLRMSLDANSEMSREERLLLLGEIHSYSVSTVCDKRELFWSNHLLNFKWSEIFRITIVYLLGTLLSRRKRQRVAPRCAIEKKVDTG
ncbi:MAG: TIGR04190 family B12-binding domain/radical SAM domain protein [Desulfuromonadales bacterium]|nr:TIGR04190 family B12-binding domain/radical SAM domain protein [Desulfuromonadales bacterium]